ncbi:phytanoyl-CoA dioxygenase, peroxisomal [Ixodes scapularis]
MGDKTRKLRNFVEAHFSGGVNTNLWMNTFSKQDGKDQSAAGNRQLLTAEQKRQYDDQGFVVVPRLVSSTFLTQASRMDVSLTQRQRLSGEAQQKAADAMHAVLAHYRNLPEVLDWVEQFCGPRLLSLAAMFVSVPPDPAGTSKQFSLHQNSNFLPFAFADEDRVVSVWTSLDCPGDRALVVVPGTHKGPTLVHSIDDKLDEMGDKTRKLRNFVEAHFSGGVNTNLWMNTFSKQDGKDQSAAGNRQLLTAEQKRQYDDQGFVVVPRLVSSTFLTQASRMDVSLTQRQRLSGEAQQKAADAMHAVLAHYRNLPEVLDWVEQFCGPRLLSLAAMFVSVPPDPAGTSKQFSLHQNSNFLPFAFADEDRVVSVWTSLDCPGDRALVVVPGTHKGPTLVHSIDDVSTLMHPPPTQQGVFLP